MFSGGISDRVPPGHMPNPEVKPVSADGTVWGTYGRVGRCQKTVERRARSPGDIPGLLARLSSSHFVLCCAPNGLEELFLKTTTKTIETPLILKNLPLDGAGPLGNNKYLEICCMFFSKEFPRGIFQLLGCSQAARQRTLAPPSLVRIQPPQP